MTSDGMSDSYPKVKVLYNYEYEDDNSKVWMKSGEIFDLLNSEGDDWWQVCREDAHDNCFYVPSTYVSVLEDGYNLTDKTNMPTHTSDHVANTMNTQPHNTSSSPTYENNNKTLHTFSKRETMDDIDEDSDYVNCPPQLTLTDPKHESFTVSRIPTRPNNFGDKSDLSGDYANLDEFRALANMPTVMTSESQTPPSPQSPEDDYANLQDLNIAEPVPPELDNLDYKKKLNDMWDMYLDPETNRMVYVHKQTHEKQWKPPRGKFHEELSKRRSQSSSETPRASGEYEDILPLPSPSPTSKDANWRWSKQKSFSLDYGRHKITLNVNVPPGWRYSMNADGNEVFINNDTLQERSNDTSPTKSPTTPDSSETSPLNHNTQQLGQGQPAQGQPQHPQGHSQPVGPSRQGQRSLGSQVSDRFAKSRSVMIDSLHFAAPISNTGPPPPKSATLPANLNAGGQIYDFQHMDEQTSRSHPDIKQPFSQSVNLNEPIEGMLNRSKIANGKKSAKKWAMTYVKLSGSNLVFYKDKKASEAKQSWPQGKYDQMLPLSTCSLDKDPKELTSKKNTILITCPECQILLSAEDDVKIQEWFMKLHRKIHELGGTPDVNPPVDQQPATLSPITLDKTSGVARKPSFRERHRRNPSDGGTLEKKGKMRDALTKFLSNRSDKKELVKKGIYKDAVFGSEVKQLCDKEKSKIPNFVSRSIAAIEKRGLEHEGLYRIGGNISMIQKLRCIVDQTDQYDLDDPVWDVNILAGTLKLFFRELKEPLFTYLLFDKLLKSFLKEQASERLKAIKANIHELPKCHFETVKLLFKHLTNVMEKSSQNKMGAHQLAIVFGPTLLWPEVQSQNLATSMVYQSRIVEFILLEYNRIFR